MRKLIMAALLLASLNSFSQDKPTGRATDLLKNQQVDSTDIPLISIKDLDETLKGFSDRVSYNTYVIIQQAYQQALTDAIKRKQAKPKK